MTPAQHLDQGVKMLAEVSDYDDTPLAEDRLVVALAGIGHLLAAIALEMGVPDTSAAPGQVPGGQ